MKCEGEKTYPKPGSCPVCKMDLQHIVPEANTAAHQSAEPAELALLLKPTFEYVLSAVKTLRPARKTLLTNLEAPGYITYDARRVQAISARFSGRIERLYVRYPLQPVRKGQRLLDIYSPEIATALQELIFLLEKDATNTALLENARRRLALLGLTAAQIAEAEISRKPALALSVFSPFEGFVFEKPLSASLNSNGEMNGGMPSGSASVNTEPAELSVNEVLFLQEGMYVQKGQRLFNVQSLSSVWAILELYPADFSAVKIGQAVSLHVEPFEKLFSGKINYIEPIINAGTKNFRARVYLENPGGHLKPGALLHASISAGHRNGLWIPKTAALDLGRQQVVFLKKDGVFRSQKIEAGSLSGGWLEVRSGISEADEIAADAQFLMDSESFVKSN